MFLNALIKEITWKTTVKGRLEYERSLSFLWIHAAPVHLAACHLFLGADHDVCVLVRTAILHRQLRQLPTDIRFESNVRHLPMRFSFHFHHSPLLVHQLCRRKEVVQA